MTTIGPLDRLRELLAFDPDGAAERAIGGRPVALGWATVELDRAAAELGGALGIPVAQFVGAAQTIALGARCRVARDVLPDGISLVLLEPATEGRLAATLARLGEGPAAIWLAVAGSPGALGEPRTPGLETSAERPGPLGAERLVLGGPIRGPHRLLLERAGTIRA